MQDVSKIDFPYQNKMNDILKIAEEVAKDFTQKTGIEVEPKRAATYIQVCAKENIADASIRRQIQKELTDALQRQNLLLPKITVDLQGKKGAYILNKRANKPGAIMHLMGKLNLTTEQILYVADQFAGKSTADLSVATDIGVICINVGDDKEHEHENVYNIEAGPVGVNGFIDLILTELSKSSSAGILNLDELDTLVTENLSKDTEVARARENMPLFNTLVTSRHAAELPKPVTEGVIAINEKSIPENQRGLLIKYLGKGSSQLKLLEENMGCTIRLISQLEADDYQGKDLIIISHEKLKEYDKAKYLSIDEARVRSSLYAHIPAYIGIAKVLLATSSDNIAQVVEALNKHNFYRYLFGHPATAQKIKEFLETGIYELPVPKANLEATEEVQRAGIAAMMAA